MITSIRSCLSSGVAVIGVSGLVLAAMPQQELVESDDPAVMPTAQVQPLPAPVIGALASPLELVDRQSTFHVELFVDFIVTGAELFGRIPPIAGTLLHEMGNGTPLPTVLSRALLAFADVEFDAGRELVGFAADWADFQIGFLRDLVAGLPAVIEDGPFGQLVTAALDVAAQVVDGVVAFSNAVIAAAETVVGDLLGEDAEAAPPAQAVVARTAEPPTASRTIQPPVAEPSDESGVESEAASDDMPTAAATTTVKRPTMPRSVAELRETLTSAAESAQDEVGGNPVDTADAESDADQADTDSAESDSKDGAETRPYSNSAQRRNNASSGG